MQINGVGKELQRNRVQPNGIGTGSETGCKRVYAWKQTLDVTNTIRLDPAVTKVAEVNRAARFEDVVP